MYKFSDIKILQLEISNYCNAACPQCPRNYFGGRTIPTVPLRSWSLSDFKKIFSVELLAQLQQVYFCGTYGDPLTNKDLVEMCKFVKDGNEKIQIGLHTNGAAGRARRYVDLAGYVDFIAFGIDGLEDTNHVYRRHVKWDRLMNNAAAFIEAGGYAIWDFIVFKHNQHQVDRARELSHDLGFREFNVKATGRFLDRAHQLNETLAVYDNNGFIDYMISVPTDPRYVNKNYQKIQWIQADTGLKHYAQSTCITCNADRIKEVYIGADGFVFPCGWLHDRLYGPEVESHDDHIKIIDMMRHAGGLRQTNIFHNNLKNIVDGEWFKIISESWQNDKRLERCGIMCGSDINLIGYQNEEIRYKQ